MLRDKNKIDYRPQVIETGWIVHWKGKKRTPDYVTRLFVDSAIRRES